MIQNSKFFGGTLLALIAMILAPLAQANDQSSVYTKSETLDSGRVAFEACFHVAGYRDDRCEKIGKAEGYSKVELHRLAERTAEGVNASSKSADEWFYRTFFGVTATGAVGLPIVNEKIWKNTAEIGGAALVGIIGGAVVGGIAGKFVEGYVRGKADAIARNLAILKNGNSTSDVDFQAYKQTMRAALNLTRLESVSNGTSLSDSLLKDLGDNSPDASEAAGVGVASVAR